MCITCVTLVLKTVYVTQCSSTMWYMCPLMVSLLMDIVLELVVASLVVGGGLGGGLRVVGAVPAGTCVDDSIQQRSPGWPSLKAVAYA